MKNKSFYEMNYEATTKQAIYLKSIINGCKHLNKNMIYFVSFKNSR